MAVIAAIIKNFPIQAKEDIQEAGSCCPLRRITAVRKPIVNYR